MKTEDDWKDKSQYFSLTEMARRRKISSRTLRYYDQIGLFQAAYVDPETGYRYYHPDQYEKLGTLLELRKLNFSLNEIREYFSDRNISKSRQMLIAHQDELRREIEEKQQLLNEVSDKVEFIDKVERGNIPEGKYQVKEFPERYLIMDIADRSDPQSEGTSFMHLEGHLNETAPILASDRIGCCCFAENAEGFRDSDNWNAAIFDVTGKAVRQLEHFRILPAGRYLTVIHRNYQKEFAERLQGMCEYAESHGLKIQGTGMYRMVIDVTLTDQAEETVVDYQALLEN